MKTKTGKAAWIWLIIPAINIPLGIGIVMVVRGQVHSIREAATARQEELIARNEQLERERAEAEARAEREYEADREANEQPPVRPPSQPGNNTPPGSQSPGSDDEEDPSDEVGQGDFVLLATCNQDQNCSILTGLESSDTVHVSLSSDDIQLDVPPGWTRRDRYTIEHVFRHPREGDPAPLTIEISSIDGRYTTTVTFPVDQWFDKSVDSY
ncbi:hypothetical protein FWC63_00905 [Candidatus Saccharibacteria bacterium]|nr:hypothetical protein [Candidatus Saccharibacteria bacterium]